MMGEKREIERSDLRDMQTAIMGAEAIFIALSWIDEGYLDGTYSDPHRLSNVRSNLLAAGETLCRVTAARF
ncbi:hypothetical protein [Reyranella sp.]|uniref:hypothetical protein n=1 Tax=Reyranella sp. TaxID=1929291 RepID=UPI003784DA0E